MREQMEKCADAEERALLMAEWSLDVTWFSLFRFQESIEEALREDGEESEAIHSWKRGHMCLLGWSPPWLHGLIWTPWL